MDNKDWKVNSSGLLMPGLSQSESNLTDISDGDHDTNINPFELAMALYSTSEDGDKPNPVDDENWHQMPKEKENEEVNAITITISDPSATMGNRLIGDAQKILNALKDMKNKHKSIYDGNKEGLLILSQLKKLLESSLQTVKHMYSLSKTKRKSIISNSNGSKYQSGKIWNTLNINGNGGLFDEEECKGLLDGIDINDNLSVFSDATGITAITSISGITGATDVTGVSGMTGVTGVTGLSGFTGVTGITGITGITHNTGVSSIAGSITMNDPLIVMMGIGKYNGLPDLDGVEKDYNNIIDTFVNFWKFKVFYKLDNNNNSNVYTNENEELKRNYKLKWSGDEIDLFLEEARHCVVKNKHNGLIFAISSHGDSGRVLKDSNCESYELDSLYSCFSPQASVLLESYKETEEESNHLFQIPKMFLLDMCRGSFQAKVTKLSVNDTSDTHTKTNEFEKHLGISLHKNDKSDNNNNNSNKSNKSNNSTSKSKENTNDNTNTTKNNATTPKKPCVGKEENKTTSDNESFTLKGSKLLSKEDASAMVAQMANFCKIYANTDGCAVADGSINGGVFLRNVCNVFKDTKFVTKHKWNEIVIKIREYTKRDATLYCNLVNFTQLVENEGTLERPVVFGSKYLNIAPLLSHLAAFDEMNPSDFSYSAGLMNNLESGDEFGAEVATLVITNCSIKNKIAVLVEMEQNRAKRKQLIKSLIKNNGKNRERLFIENGFVIIDKYQGDHKFHKVWDEYYVTLFKLPNDEKSNNVCIYERRLFFSDYLYYKKSQLHTMHDEMSSVRPKCNAIQDESHKLVAIEVEAPEPSMTKEETPAVNSCVLCKSEIAIEKFRYYCKECNHSFCQHCMHSLFLNEIPKNMKFDETSIKLPISNFSPTNKLAVMVHPYANVKNKSRGKIISNYNYKRFSDKEFIENGFVIIDQGGSDHQFGTVWNEFSLTLIKIEEKADNVLLYHKSDVPRTVDEAGMYFANGTLQFVTVNVPSCNAVAHKSHKLQPFIAGKELMELMDITADSISCVLCSSDISIGSVAYYCIECNHSFCKRCCYSLYWNKVPRNIVVKSPKEKNMVYLKNLSQTNKIVALIGIHGGYNKSRKDIIDTSKYEDIIDEKKFTERGFSIVEANGGNHWFDTVWKSCHVTVIELAIQQEQDQIVGNRNRPVYYGMLDFDEKGKGYLYYDGKKLITKHETTIKCTAVTNEKHSVNAIWIDEDEVKNNQNLNNCSLCLCMIKLNSFGYYCKKCNHSICEQCLDSLCWNKIPPNIKSTKKLSIKNMNLNKSEKIAILITIDDPINMDRFLGLQNEKQFVENGFIIIDGNGASHLFNTLWGSCYIIAFKITNINSAQLIYGGMEYVDSNDKAKQLCYNGGQKTLASEMVGKCRNVLNESHSLNSIWINDKRLTKNCVLCSYQIKSFGYYCKKCNHTLCEECFDSLCWNKFPPFLKSDAIQSKLHIKNMSQKDKIAVRAVVSEDERESVNNLIKTLKYSSLTQNQLAQEGFVIIESHGESHLFDAFWRLCYLTVIKIIPRKSNSLVYNDMFKFTDNITQFYYKNDKLVCAQEMVAKCRAVSDEAHSLRAIWHGHDVNGQDEKEFALETKIEAENERKTATNDISTQNICVLCSLTTKSHMFSYYCDKCKHSLCSECFNSLCENEIPPNLKPLGKGRKLNIKNISEVYKIAVLAHVNNGQVNKYRNDMIDTSKYKRLNDENEFIQNGFTIIDTNGDEKWFETVWGISCHVTVIKITSEYMHNMIIYDELINFKDNNKTEQFYFRNDNFVGGNDILSISMSLPKCPNEYLQVHSLSGVWVDENDSRCSLCSLEIKANRFSYNCNKCNHLFCQKCCDSFVFGTATNDDSDDEDLGTIAMSRGRKLSTTVQMLFSSQK